MNFSDWNTALAKHFFKPEMAGKRVFLYVTQELLNLLGSESGKDWRDFVETVKSRNENGASEQVCREALKIYKNWREKGITTPPYLCFLGLFVLAAGVEGECASHAYYPRLRTILNESGSGIYPGFDKMWQIWEDLSIWANEDCEGQNGIFNANIAGGWINVGFPIAQTVLTETERAALPSIFDAASFDPTSPPPDAEIARKVLIYADGSLRKRTRKLIENHASEPELSSVIVDTIREELLTWDGRSILECADSGLISGHLRWCLSIDRIAKYAKFTLRCSLNREYPVNPLNLEDLATGTRFTCEAEFSTWSSPLHNSTTSQLLGLTDVSIDSKTTLRDTANGLVFRHQSSDMLVFIKADSVGLPGYVEANSLPPMVPAILMYRSELDTPIYEWATANCKVATRLTLKGVTPGWQLIEISGMLPGASECPEFSLLAPPTQIRVTLQRGIRASRHNWYFSFGLPIVTVDAPTKPDYVRCAETDLKPTENGYILPQKIPLNTKLHVEVKLGDKIVLGRPFFIIDNFNWRGTEIRHVMDRYGRTEAVNPTSSGICGCQLINVPLVAGPYVLPVCGISYKRILLVGRIPGQILSWPSNQIPDDWKPIWIIGLDRRGKATFCGTSIEDSDPLSGSDRYSRQEIKAWRDILYYRRRQIQGPGSRQLGLLWNKFVKAAKNA